MNLSEAPNAASRRGQRHLIAAAALLLFLVNFGLRFPGTLSFDAAKQYEQVVSGHYNDWHPPIMAFAWSWLAPLGGVAPSMLAAQLVGHWLGFGLIADGLQRVGRRTTAWIMLLSGASPYFLYFDGIIVKDVGMASTLIAAFGVAFWYRVQQRAVPIAPLLFALLCIAYGTLVRTNGVFAFGPILLYVLLPSGTITTARLLMLSLVLAVVALPLSSFVNRSLLKAQPSGAMQALQLWDLAGIAHGSGDVSVLPPGINLTTDQLDHCYSPQHWLPLELPLCGRAFQRLPSPGSPQRDAINGVWVHAIVLHPVAYAEHRLDTFNALLHFFVPAQQCRFLPFDSSCGTPDPRTGLMLQTSDSARFIHSDYLKKNVLVWPATWLALGMCLASLLWFSPRSPAVMASNVLLVSALFYAWAFLVVGVAADVRYFYWPVLAIQTATILGWERLVQRFRKGDRAVWIALGIFVLVVAIGFFARITDNQALIRP